MILVQKENRIKGNENQELSLSRSLLLKTERRVVMLIIHKDRPDDPRAHYTDGPDCWCNPTAEPTEPNQSAFEIRKELQGDTPLIVCNREAGSYSSLWARDCWVADSVLKLVQCSIDEKMDKHDPTDPLFKVWQYCQELREKNRIGEFNDVVV